MARPVRARPTSVYRPRSGVAASRQSWRVHCARLPQQRSTRSALCHPCYFPEGRTETLRCRQPQAPTAEGARLNPKATAYVPLSSDGKGTQNHQCCARGASCHGEPFAGPGSLDPSQKRKNFMVSNTEDAEGRRGEQNREILRGKERILGIVVQRTQRKNESEILRGKERILGIVVHRAQRARRKKQNQEFFPARHKSDC